MNLLNIQKATIYRCLEVVLQVPWPAGSQLSTYISSKLPTNYKWIWKGSVFLHSFLKFFSGEAFLNFSEKVIPKKTTSEWVRIFSMVTWVCRRKMQSISFPLNHVGKNSFENHSTYWFTLFTNLKTASDELNITIHLK